MNYSSSLRGHSSIQSKLFCSDVKHVPTSTGALINLSSGLKAVIHLRQMVLLVLAGFYPSSLEFNTLLK